MNRSRGAVVFDNGKSIAATRLSRPFVPRKTRFISMGHKILKDHAHTICQMFVGWRMVEDLELFATLPEGLLTIDILRGSCSHESRGKIETSIAGEINAWFKHRLTTHKIEESEIRHAILTVQLKRIPPVSKRHRGVSFDWRCEGVIRTADREYRSQLNEPHTWIPAATPNPKTGTNNPMNPSGGLGVS